MSLQLWLPLINDTHNQGLSNYTITTLGTLSWVTGKLGATAMRAGDGTQIINGLQINNNFTELLNGDYSISVWVKPYGTHVHYNGSIMSSGNWNTANKRWAFGVSQDNTKVDVLGYNYNTYINCTVPENEWTHLVCTCGSDRKIKLYKNGEYIGVRDGSSDPAIDSDASVTCIGRESYASGYFSFNGAIQDLRLYDHCLSPMKVKQLSQGLVLHYTLNRSGWGQENLMPGTYRADGNNTNKVHGWMNNGYGAPEIVIKDGNECIHLQGNCTGAYTPSIVSASKLLLENSIEYIVSCDLMYDKEIKVTNSTPIHYHNGSTDSTDPFNLTNANNGKGFTWKSIKPVAGTIIPANTWQHYEMRFTAVATPSDSSLPYSTYRAFIYGAVRTTSETATVNMWLKNWKIEKGTKATPWCPNSADTLATTLGINGTIEYDCSGYCNNGTKNNITYTSDAPKYNVSSIFNGSNSYIKVNDNTWMIKGMSAMTVNLWAKTTTWPTNGGRLVSCTETGGFNLEAGNSGYWRFPIYVYTNSEQTSSAYKYDSNEIKISDLIPNQWNMITLVYNLSGTKTYINGNLHHTYTNTSYGINFNTNARLFLGCEAITASPSAPYFNGMESDFRIYATALSANDIKSLYQNSAYVDSSGNVHGAIH